MGLDIYAGPLTRYYSHNWKTVVQQWAEENGYTFNRITPDGEPADNEEELSPAEIQAAVEDWRDQILAAISQPNQPHYTPWPEDNERPYYTDKPDWDAFGAMLLVAACHTYEEPVPPTVEKDWDFGEHPLIARFASDEERVWSLFRGATWWLSRQIHYTVTMNGSSTRIPITEIAYFESQGHYIVVHYNESSLRFKARMSDIETALSKYFFVRCHVGYLLNCRFVQICSWTSVTLTDGTVLPVSRAKAEETQTAFMAYMRSLRP